MSASDHNVDINVYKVKTPVLSCILSGYEYVYDEKPGFVSFALVLCYFNLSLYVYCLLK